MYVHTISSVACAGASLRASQAPKRFEDFWCNIYGTTHVSYIHTSNKRFQFGGTT